MKEKQIIQYSETISLQKDTINLKDSIINDDIKELKRLRDKITELETKTNPQL